MDTDRAMMGRTPRTSPHVSLRTLRQATGKTLADVAAAISEQVPELDVSRGTLSAIETGARGVSDLMLRALERAYGLDDGAITTDYTPVPRQAVAS